MKRFLFLIVLYMPLLLKAQMENHNDKQGIKWVEVLSWDEIKAKAKQENKYIFMDCYATWCIPCKKMDKEIYPNEKLGKLVNEKFIAVKVQMDSTRDDIERIQKWYRTVQELNKKYTIPGYPAYLFFSPEGELVHQDEGYKSVEDFISLVSDVINPSTQFAKIMEHYKSGERDPASVVKAIKAARKLGQKELADSLARSYKASHLDKLDDANLFTKDNIQFVAQDFSFLFYEEGSKGRFFNFFYHHPQKVDSVFFKGFAEIYVKAIITQEEITHKLIRNAHVVTETPDWENIRKDIALKYGNYYAQIIVSDYQPIFYRYIGDWQRWADLFEGKIKANSLYAGSKNLGVFGDDWILNDNAWTAFKSCNDRTVLLRALKWSELAIKLKTDGRIDGYLDTKANLLYKLGKRKKAIKIERKALRLNTEFARKEGKEKGSDFEEFSENIRKMEAGIPTWKVK